MKTSERIRLIKEIAKALSSEEWTSIDITLESFGLPTSHNWNSDANDYVINHIKNGEDEVLLELADHLEIPIPNKREKTTELNPEFWQENQFRLFISHLASDKKRAQELKDKLGKYGISSFVAHTDITPTKEWQNEIELALYTCDALAAMMIPDFHKSNWTDQEIGIAMGRDLLIVPIRMGQDPYGFIGKFQAITFKDINTLAEELFNILIKHKKSAKAMAYSVMNKFRQSDSFQEAKDNVRLIKDIQYWDSTLIRKLERAEDANYQIAQSFGVPQKIRDLLNDIKKSDT